MLTRSLLIAVGLLAVMVLIFLSQSRFASAQSNQGSGTSLFSRLRPGQQVSIKDHGNCFSLTTYQGDLGPAGHVVVDVAADHVVVRDAVGLTEKAIPVYSVKSLTEMRLGGEGTEP